MERRKKTNPKAQIKQSNIVIRYWDKLALYVFILILSICIYLLHNQTNPNTREAINPLKNINCV